MHVCMHIRRNICLFHWHLFCREATITNNVNKITQLTWQMTDDLFFSFSFIFGHHCLSEEWKSPRCFSGCPQIIGLWGVPNIQQIFTGQLLCSRYSQYSCDQNWPDPCHPESSFQAGDYLSGSDILLIWQKPNLVQDFKKRTLRQEQRQFITCPTMWFTKRPNVIQTGVLLTLPSCFC